MAVGATATGELTGVPSRVVAVDTSAIPARTRGWSCQWLQAATLPSQQALVVGPARVVGVGHLPDGVPGLALEVVQGEVGDQGRAALRRTSAVSGLCPGVLVLAG